MTGAEIVQLLKIFSGAFMVETRDKNLNMWGGDSIFHLFSIALMVIDKSSATGRSKYIENQNCLIKESKMGQGLAKNGISEPVGSSGVAIGWESLS